MNIISAAKPVSPDGPGRTDIAQFSTRWMEPSTAVVTVHGELDAANARQFSDYVLMHIDHTEQLVLDLAGVGFFGTDSFSALHVISVRAAGEGVDWALVSSPAVMRLVKICDPDCVLPIADTVAGALTQFPHGTGQLLQLVAEAR